MTTTPDPLLLPAGQLPGPDDGIGDRERARRLITVLDQIDEEQARKQQPTRKTA